MHFNATMVNEPCLQQSAAFCDLLTQVKKPKAQTVPYVVSAPLSRRPGTLAESCERGGVDLWGECEVVDMVVSALCVVRAVLLPSSFTQVIALLLGLLHTTTTTTNGTVMVQSTNATLYRLQTDCDYRLYTISLSVYTCVFIHCLFTGDTGPVATTLYLCAFLWYTVAAVFWHAGLTWLQREWRPTQSSTILMAQVSMLSIIWSITVVSWFYSPICTLQSLTMPYATGIDLEHDLVLEQWSLTCHTPLEFTEALSIVPML